MSMIFMMDQTLKDQKDKWFTMKDGSMKDGSAIDT